MALPTTNLLIEKVVAIVENEAISISRVRDEIDEIKQELVSMKSFLQDADGKKEHSKGEETWVASVRELAYDVEDIIDEFMYNMYEKQTGGPFARWLHKSIHIPRNLYYKRQIANKLQKTSKMIKAIPDRYLRYGIGGLEGTRCSIDVHKSVKNQSESSLFIKEDELVGIEGNKQTILGWLMDKQQPAQAIVSVFGMGGSGKTTLVAKTFTDEKVKRHFECYAWISVSRTYVIEDLFRSLIKEFHQSRKEKVPSPAKLKNMSYRELLGKLVNYLNCRRYLVVLDDVWDIKLWGEIHRSLPDKSLGSRILLTTRNEDIARYFFGVLSHVHHMKPLNKNEAWELFSKKAFSNYHNRLCTPELEPLASKLVEKCKGLPLAIVALGGLMSSKKSTTEWEDVYNSLKWHLSNNPLLDNVKSILLLSYNDLPFRLKQCFLYCSLFPEDYLIRRKRLFRLWISEGLVQQVQVVTLQAASENYLMELIFRSMLQVVRRNETGRPKAFKMHDLMRELALSMSEREKFSAVYTGKEVLEETGARRLSIQSTEGTEMKSFTGISKLRTFLVFVTGIIPLSFSNALPSGFKLLRVLDVEDMPLAKLPNDLVYLFNLRYLNLKGTAIRELPKSIGQLHNLQFLDIRKTKIEALPRGISKLLNLCHLMMYYNNKDYSDFKILNGTRATSNISKLKKLQVLSRVQSEGNIIRLLGYMTQLTRIGITNLTKGDEMELCDSIQKMKLLTNLSLMVKDEEEILQVDNAHFSPPPHLRKLSFIGKLQKVPHWFSSLQSLTSMHLHWPRLDEDLLSHIEGLPFLGSLALVNAFAGNINEFHFSRGFVKLLNLQLYKFPSLSKITVAKGVMPDLQFLTLNSCMELKRLPHGLEHLTNLHTLSLEFLSIQLIESIREGGVDRPKVQHILEINHFFDTSGGRSYESLSPRALYQ